MKDISDWFSLEETKCKCGCGFTRVNTMLLYRLNMARYIAGMPFVINSWCRCEEYNLEVSGLEDSSHLKGYAVDIETPTFRRRYIMFHSLMLAGFTRFGLGKHYMHVDIDPSKPIDAIWFYPEVM